LLAIALRRAGKVAEAQTRLNQVLLHDPLNHPALHEKAVADFPESVEALHKLQRSLADDDQYSMDLGCYYLDAGLPEDSLEVLEAAWSQKATAMTAYLLAFLSHQTGDASAEKAWLDKAQQASPEFGFPSRLEEVAALQFALEQDPEDSKANYFLGNFYYAHERHDEAVQLWNDAVKRMDPYDVIFRNLGLAAWQRHHNPSEAIDWLEKALALNPNNQDLYLHLDEIYKSQKSDPKREQLLTKINVLSAAREDVRKHAITMMVELGHYQEAIELMTAQTYVPLEMDQSFHDVYVRALMLRAQDHLTGGRLEDAVRDYHKMLEYPENLGVGAPTTRAQAHIYYRLGLAYEKLGKYRQAIKAWREAASEHHPRGTELFTYIQMALDKLSRYSELGLEE
jgi:tetratricopeptide (TPR) repeat protein